MTIRVLERNDVSECESGQCVQQYASLLEGYYLENAVAKIEKIFHRTRLALQGCLSQTDLEKKVEFQLEGIANYSDYTKKIKVAKALSLVSGLIELAPFDFDVKKWIRFCINDLKGVNGEYGYERIVPLIQFFELWSPYFSEEEQQEILQKIYNCVDKPNVNSLCTNKILNILPIEKVESTFKYLLNYFPLPINSSLAQYEIPNKYQNLYGKFIERDSTIDTIPEIYFSNNLGYRLGDCDLMDEYFCGTILSNSFYERTYGSGYAFNYGDAVLIYVKDKLVGAIKMNGMPSFIAFRTIKDSKGRFPMVLCGVYGTYEEINKRAKAVFVEQGKWAKLAVEELPLFPLRMLEYVDDKDTDYYAEQIKKRRDCPNFGIHSNI